MPRRTLSESGYYHITTRSAGQIALFEDERDRRKYLFLLKNARDEYGVRVIAWVLMTDHVHLIVDFGSRPEDIGGFMKSINLSYSKYFNARTGRSGTLFQGSYWSKPILDDAQLIATVYYVHMNPEVAGIAPMRTYHWSSYQEYAGIHWVVDTTTVLGLFGSFETFDAYAGSDRDVVSRTNHPGNNHDGDVLKRALELGGLMTSSELRSLPKPRRNELITLLAAEGVSTRKLARTFGIGASTISRILRASSGTGGTHGGTPVTR